MMRFTGILVIVVATACGGGSNNTPADAAPVVDAPPDTSNLDCFPNPQTHDEIINACTSAQKIKIEDLRGAPPLLNPDGTLPPLPP